MPYKDDAKQKEYQQEWSKNKTKAVYLKLMRTTDADIIEHLASKGNVQGYIKELIRNDMKIVK